MGRHGLFTYVVVPLVACLALLFIKLDADYSTYLSTYFPHDYYRDKVVWVTGASSGIGEYYAREVARQGAKVVISARREQALERVRHSIEAVGGEVRVVAFDLINTTAHTIALQAVMEAYGRIDVLVLNAGQYQTSVVTETPEHVVRRMMELNFLSAVFMTQATLPHMLKQASGHIVITSSFAGIVGVPLAASYTASKHALHGFFEALRMELWGTGVKVTIACPGPVMSEVFEHTLVTNQGVADYKIQSPPRSMPTERCAALMASGVAHGLRQLWISEQPTLLFYYLAQYSPDLASRLLTPLGAARTRLFKKGEDANGQGAMVKEVWAGYQAEKKRKEEEKQKGGRSG